MSDSRILWAAGLDGVVQLADGDDQSNIHEENFTRETAKAKAMELREAGECNIEILARHTSVDGSGRIVPLGAWFEAGKIVTWSEALSEIDNLWIEGS